MFVMCASVCVPDVPWPFQSLGPCRWWTAVYTGTPGTPRRGF